MSLFEFNLTPLSEVLPWEHEGKKYLHWFGLTDGLYHMNVNGTELFKYSKEYNDFLIKMFPDENNSTLFIDYQIIRLYEDFIEILPNILQNIPNNIVDIIQSSELENKLYREFDLLDVDDSRWDIYANATRLWGCRHLSTMHLRHGSKIIFWNHNDEIHISWDNSYAFENGIQVWEALKGEEKYNKVDFLNEVNKFHNRLMDEMEDRILEIEKNNPIPQIHIDIKQLKNEQEERRKALQTALQTEPEIKDWDEVFNAIITINK